MVSTLDQVRLQTPAAGLVSLVKMTRTENESPNEFERERGPNHIRFLGNEFVAVAAVVTTKDTNYVNIHKTRAPGCMRPKREMNFLHSVSH